MHKSYPRSFFWHCGLNHLPCQLFKPPQLGASVRRASSSPLLSALRSRSSQGESKLLQNFYFQCLIPTIGLHCQHLEVLRSNRSTDHLKNRQVNLCQSACFVCHNSTLFQAASTFSLSAHILSEWSCHLNQVLQMQRKLPTSACCTHIPCPAHCSWAPCSNGLQDPALQPWATTSCYGWRSCLPATHGHHQISVVSEKLQGKTGASSFNHQFSGKVFCYSFRQS